ncbi:MAG: hypothetical protein WCI95_03115 [bacterium]
MTTFLSKIPQNVNFAELREFEPGLDSAIRDVAQGFGTPVINGISSLLESMAAVRMSQMLHDAEDKDAFTKGVIKGLLTAAALPGLCNDFVNPKKEGKEQ